MTQIHRCLLMAVIVAVSPGQRAGAQGPPTSKVEWESSAALAPGVALCSVRKAIIRTMRGQPADIEYYRSLLKFTESRIRGSLSMSSMTNKKSSVDYLCAIAMLRLKRGPEGHELTARRRVLIGGAVLGIGLADMLSGFVMLKVCQKQATGYCDNAEYVPLALELTGVGLIMTGALSMAIGNRDLQPFRQGPVLTVRPGPGLVGISLAMSF